MFYYWSITPEVYSDSKWLTLKFKKDSNLYLIIQNLGNEIQTTLVEIKIQAIKNWQPQGYIPFIQMAPKIH